MLVPILLAYAEKGGAARTDGELDPGRRAGNVLPRSTQNSRRLQDSPAVPGQLQFVPVPDKFDYGPFDRCDRLERERRASVAVDWTAIDRPWELPGGAVTAGADEEERAAIEDAQVGDGWVWVAKRVKEPLSGVIGIPDHNTPLETIVEYQRFRERQEAAATDQFALIDGRELEGRQRFPRRPIVKHRAEPHGETVAAIIKNAKFGDFD